VLTPDTPSASRPNPDLQRFSLTSGMTISGAAVTPDSCLSDFAGNGYPCPSMAVPEEKPTPITPITFSDEQKPKAVEWVTHYTFSRVVKTYPIQEHELLALDDLGRNSALWTAIGSAALALVGSCVWSMLQSPHSISTEVKGFTALLLFVSAASFIIGRLYGKRRKARLEKIMNECQD
jgi:hypothetical protein